MTDLNPDWPGYRVAYSQRLDSWYVADLGGDPASGLYDTEADATQALTEGAF